MFDWCHVLFVFAVSFALASFGLLLLYGLLMRAQILLLAFAVVLLALIGGLELIAVIIVVCCVSEVHLMLYKIIIIITVSLLFNLNLKNFSKK